MSELPLAGQSLKATSSTRRIQGILGLDAQALRWREALTGWREDGENGYIWAASTPTVLYYEYHHTRSGNVVKELIGEDFGGVLGSDFYAGYNIHQGLHQRCWVHYLRHVHELKEKYPHDEHLLTGAKGIKEKPCSKASLS